MTWPQFLNPWTASIAAAIAVPLLLILYFLKLRRQERVVSSTILWRKAIQDLQVNAPFQRLRRNLLLFLQLLLLLLLGLALSRPVVQHNVGAGEVSVILIDRSASMSATDLGKSRLDEAKRQATDLVNSMKRGARCMVISFDETAQTVQAFTTDTAALRNAIASITPSDKYSRLKLAFQLADAQLAFIPEQNRPSSAPPDVWLYSDGKVLDSSEELTLQGNLKYVKLGTDDATNVAIVAMSAKRNFERPSEVQVFARLANYGPQPATVSVQLSVNDAVNRLANVELPPKRWSDAGWKKDHPSEIPANFETRDSVEFTLDLKDAATLKLEHLYRNDTLASDNAVNIILPPARQLKVMLVTQGNIFLNRGMLGVPTQEFKTVKPSEYEGKVPDDMDLVIFDRYFPRTLPDAGAFMYFASAPPDSKLKPALEEDGRVKFVEDPVVLDWRREHPILSAMLLSKLHIKETMQIDLPLESQVLIDSTKGPLMVLFREARRTHLVIGFDIMQSDWVFDASYPIFLLQATEYMALSSQVNVRESLPPGASPTIDRSLLNRVDPTLAQLTLSGPMAAKVAIPASGDVVLPPLEKVGLYTLSPAIPSAEQFAVNLLSEQESNLMPSAMPPGQAGEVIAAQTGKSRLELWWWIIAAVALPLLLIEWWVYTRRVHL